MQEDHDKLLEEIREFLRNDSSKTEMLLSPQEAADYLNLSLDTLKRWRRRGGGPCFYRLPAVRYRLADLETFIRERLVLTSEKTSK